MADPIIGYSSVEDQSYAAVHGNMRLLIVGMTASGKSALGNKILGAVEQMPIPFVSKSSPVPVTTDLDRKAANVFGYRVSVVDTPGLFSTANYHDHIDETDVFMHSISLLRPGPHAILLLVKVCRFTEEVVRGFERMRESFGENGKRFLIVVFTNVDSLYDNDDSDDEDEDQDEGSHHSVAAMRALKLQQYVNGIPEGHPCRDLLESCDMRYVGINNKFKPTSEDNQQQIKQLLSTVDKLSKSNGKKCFTRELLDKDINANKGWLYRSWRCFCRYLSYLCCCVCIVCGWLYTTCTKKCFASDSMVRVQDVQGHPRSKFLAELNVGDLVESYDPKTNSVTYSPIYYIIYQGDNDHVSTLRELFYQSNDGQEHSLRLHGKHLVYATINSSASLDLATPPSAPIISEKVNIGDVLWVVEDDTGVLCPRRVMKVSNVEANVRHPMTMNHTIIVDGVLASVHTHSEWFLRLATIPLRLLYRINPRLSGFWFSKKAVECWSYVERYFLE